MAKWARYAKREMWHEVGERLPGMIYTVCKRRIPETATYRDDRPDEHLTCWSCLTRGEWQGYARARGAEVRFSASPIQRVIPQRRPAPVLRTTIQPTAARTPLQKVCAHQWAAAGFGAHYVRCRVCALIGAVQLKARELS